MDEIQKTIFEISIAVVSALSSVIVAMAVYFVKMKKEDKRDAKENLTKMMDVLLKNSDSNIALSNSIERAQDNQERISVETQRLLTSLTKEITELKYGKH